MSADSWLRASSRQDVGLISRAQCRCPRQVGWWYGKVTRFGQGGGGMRKSRGDVEKVGGGASPINSAKFPRCSALQFPHQRQRYM